MQKLVKCLVVCLITTQSAEAEANWPNWRGPNSNGTAGSGNYPIKWDQENVLWKVDIPGKGFSTPIVWDKQIYLTTGTNGLDTVLAFAWSGRQIWQEQLGNEVAGRHTNGSGSNPSATTDGTGVFVYFKSGNFAALELDGSVRWKANLFERYGEDDRFWDFGTSPVLTEKDVVIAEMHDGDSWVAAFDKITGELHWKVPRNYETPTEGRQGYATPIIYSHKGTEALLIWGGQHLTTHDASDGRTLWSCGNFNPEAKRLWPSVASPVISGTMAIVPCGRADRNQPRLHGIKLDGSGDVTETHRLWKREDIGPFIPTPVAYQGRVYVIHDRGQVDCIDPSTGKSVWSGVFPKGKGNFYSSPLIAGGHLYIAREDGMLYVLKLGDTFEIVSEIDMGDRIIASPVAISGRLLIRTRHHLFCVGDE